MFMLLEANIVTCRYCVQSVDSVLLTNYHIFTKTNIFKDFLFAVV